MLASENAAYYFAAVEQYCNIKVKLLIRQLDKEKIPGGLRREFDKTMSDLDAPIHLSPTSERYSLKGSAYKRKNRLYQKNDKPAVPRALRETAKN